MSKCKLTDDELFDLADMTCPTDLSPHNVMHNVPGLIFDAMELGVKARGIGNNAIIINADRGDVTYFSYGTDEAHAVSRLAKIIDDYIKECD